MEKITKRLKIKALITCLLVSTILSYLAFKSSKNTFEFVVFFTTCLVTIVLLLYVSIKSKHLSRGDSLDTFIVFDEDERSLKLDVKARRYSNDLMFRLLILLLYTITFLNIRQIAIEAIIIVWGITELLKDALYYRRISKLYSE